MLRQVVSWRFGYLFGEVSLLDGFVSVVSLGTYVVPDSVEDIGGSAGRGSSTGARVTFRGLRSGY